MQSKIIEELIGALQLSDKDVIFPKVRDIDSETYCGYFESISARLKRAKKPAFFYETLILRGADTACLQGLEGYFSKNPAVFFKSIALDLSSVQDDWLASLFITLKSMSTSGVHRVELQPSDCLTKETIEALVAFIEQEPAIALDICLPPPYQTQSIQKHLDTITESRPRMVQNRTTKKQPNVSANTTLRKRSGVYVNTVDVEIQETQQQETSQETNMEFANTATRQEQSEAYTIDTFTQALQAGSFSLKTNSHYLDTSRHNAHQLWCTWVGAFNRRGALLSRIKLTHQACAMLLRHAQAFQFGIDFQALPAGFLLEERGEDQILDFDAGLERIHNPHKLAVSLVEPPLSPPLLQHEVNALTLSPALSALWAQLNLEPYDRIAHRQFRQYLPYLQILTEEQLDALLPLIRTKTGMLDSNRLQFLLDCTRAISNTPNPPKDSDTNLNMQVSRLFDETSAPLAIQFILNCPKKASEKKCVHSEQAQELIDQFSPSQRAWFDALSEQHMHATDTTDIYALAKAFAYFKGALDELFGHEVILPSNGNFKNIKNMPNALSRMLAILKHIPEQNRLEQLAMLPDLDLSSTGVTKLVKKTPGTNWTFFTPQMQLTEKEAYCDSMTTDYSVPQFPFLNHSYYLQWGTNLTVIPEGMPFDRVLPYINAGICIDGTNKKILKVLDKEQESVSYTRNSSISTSIGIIGGNWNLMDRPSNLKIEGLNQPIHNLHGIKKEEESLLGESWQDYQEHMQQLIKGKPHGFISQADIKKIHLLDKDGWDFYGHPYSGGLSGQSYVGINIHFLSALPSLDDNRYDDSLIYIRPHLYRVIINNGRQLDEVFLNKPLEPAILASIDNAKAAFQHDHPDASPEELAQFNFNFETLDTNPIQHWYLNSITVLDILDRHKALEKLEYPLEQTIRDYFRYASVQNPYSAVPLSIYTYIHQEIQKHEASKISKSFLYIALVESLANTSFDPNKMKWYKECIDAVIASMSSVDSEMRVYDWLLHKRSKVPPLPFFSVYFFWHLSCSIINVRIREHAQEFSGMHQYFEEELKASQYLDFESHLITQHLNTYKALNKIYLLSDSSSYIIREGLLGLISTFHLKLPCKFQKELLIFNIFDTEYAMDSPLCKLINRYFDEGHKKKLEELLSLLMQLRVVESGLKEPLTQANFEEILTTVLTTTQPIKTFLENYQPNKNRLLDYFPHKTINPALADYQIPTPVRTLITNFFPQTRTQRQLEEFLIQFREAAYYHECVQDIIGICNRLDPHEHGAFIQRLLDVKSLYTPITTLHPAHSPLMQLLKKTRQSGEVSTLLFILDMMHRQDLDAVAMSPSTPTSQRLLRYFEKIKPVTDAFVLCSLNPVELTQRLTQTLLKTPSDELEREGCSLLFWEKPPTQDTLAHLKLPHHAAYIHCNNTLYYVNKAMNQCIPIKWNNDQQAAFNQKYNAPVSRDTLHSDDLNFLSQYHHHTDDYSRRVTKIYSTIDNLIKRNPNTKQALLALWDAYHKKATAPFIDSLEIFVETLTQHVSKLTDTKSIIALYSRYKTTPELLIHCLKDIPKAYEKVFTQILIAEKNLDKKSFNTLCTKAKNNTALMHALETMLYVRPPYPSINTVLEWDVTASIDTAYASAMQTIYQNFTITPFARSKDNGFKAAKAKEQLALMKENNQPYDSSDFDPDAFEALTTSLRQETPDALLARLKTPLSREELLALCAELLYKSTGDELNTTQYLSAYSSLKTPGHALNQIDTGEGKSRILTVIQMCLGIQGKTQDLTTSDMYLAEDAFVKSQPAFQMLGIPTQLIFSNASPEDYLIHGINFSDATNLILFRNRARSLQKGACVLDPNPENRTLVLDEADKTYFDAYSNRHNFSTAGDPQLRNVPWIYTLLIGYFMQQEAGYDPWDLFKNDIDRCRDTFLHYAKNHPVCLEDEDKITQLHALSHDKIEEWQTMAFVAMQQRYQTHFDIKPDQLLQTERGLKMSSETVLVIDNDWAEHSKLSFGADQCHKAYLNYLWKNPDRNPDLELKEALAACHYGFHIPDEKQIVYSSTSKNFLDDYQNGLIKAVTGTAGSFLERYEGHLLYQSPQNNRPMTFIDMPREKGFYRNDKAIYLTQNKKDQLNAIVDAISDAISRNQPILIIAEDGRESQALYQKIQKRIGYQSSFFSKKNGLADTTELQLVHPNLSAEERAACIKKAGNAGQITVSTGTLGRGTDINLQSDDAKKHGLLVINTFLPTERNQKQYAGRSARYGQKGSYMAILDKNRLKKALNKTTLTDGFYTHTEDYIRQEQRNMDRRSQVNRLLDHTVGDFRYQFTQHFFDVLETVPAGQSDVLRAEWSTFFAKTDQLWNAVDSDVRDALAKQDIDETQRQLTFYSKKVLEQWEHLKNRIRALQIRDEQGVLLDEALKNPENPLAFTAFTKSLLSQISPEKPHLKKTHIYDEYEPEHDGRAVRYRSMFTPVIARIKGWLNLLPGVHFEHARRPFANVRAWLEGRGQLFVNFRASPNKGLIIGSGVLGAVLASAAILTLILAPWLLAIAIPAIIALTIGAALVYSALSGITGAILDRITEDLPLQQQDSEPSLSSWNIMQQDLKNQKELRDVSEKPPEHHTEPLFERTPNHIIKGEDPDPEHTRAPHHT